MKTPRISLTAVCVLALLAVAGRANATIGWAGNVWPNSGANVVPTGPVNVYAQVWKGGTTDSPGQGADITAELRYTTNIAPMQVVAMTFQGDVGSNDEYTAQVPQAALVGASYVDVTVVFTDQTDLSTFEVTGDQAGHSPPLRYNVIDVLPNDVAVTFTLCMSGTPTSGPPCVIGSAPEIGTWVTGVNMTNVSGELWNVTVTFLAGSNPYFEYKYKADNCSNWESVGNRAVTLPTNGTTSVTLGNDSFNNAPMGCGIGQVLERDKTVCFQVCMGDVQSPPVCVIGSAAQIGAWGTGVTMSQIGTETLHQVCVTFAAGTPIPLPIEYKYKKDGCSNWESVGNRALTIDNSTPDMQTIMDTWDNGSPVCAPVKVRETTWGQLKVLYR